LPVRPPIREGGFSLIELLIIVAALATLAAMVEPKFAF
jgi:Tfp pilus assembly protein FimT